VNYIKPEDIKAYVEEHPEGVAGMSEALATMANHFVAIAVYDCIDVCKSRVGNSDYNTGRLHCVSDIKERFGLDGMSTEDKKALIKELLGVKNG
jgi:hypothetical protein